MLFHIFFIYLLKNKVEFPSCSTKNYITKNFEDSRFHPDSSKLFIILQIY